MTIPQKVLSRHAGLEEPAPHHECGGINKAFKSLDPGLRRDDEKGRFPTFYEIVKFGLQELATAMNREVLSQEDPKHEPPLQEFLRHGMEFA